MPSVFPDGMNRWQSLPLTVRRAPAVAGDCDRVCWERGHFVGCVRWRRARRAAPPYSLPGLALTPTPLPPAPVPPAATRAQLHNRYFASVNNYTEMPQFKNSFLVDGNSPVGVPVDKALFTYIMSKGQSWGARVYEQDWCVRGVGIGVAVGTTPRASPGVPVVRECTLPSMLPPRLTPPRPPPSPSRRLYRPYQTLPSLYSNVSAALAWMNAMGDAAADLHLTIQYCLPEPRHIVGSTSIPAVTHARITGDYHPNSVTTSLNWNLAPSSLLYSAVGIQPFKDVFWSGAGQQPGSRYGPGAYEPNPDMHLIISVLTTGPVGPGDAIDHLNASLTMTCCRAGDGLILKPDRPATTPDAAFWAAAFNASAPPRGDFPLVNVSTTYSTQGYGTAGGPLRWHYVLAIDLPAPFMLTFADLGPSWGVSQYVAYDYWAPLGGGLAVVDADYPHVIPTGQGLPSPAEGAFPQRYHVLAPVLPSGHVLYGELGKVAPASAQRLSNLVATADGFTAIVTAATAENVTYAYVNAGAPPTSPLSTVLCRFTGAGMSQLKCGASGCTGGVLYARARARATGLLGA
jgi:hypothetical protein